MGLSEALSLGNWRQNREELLAIPSAAIASDTAWWAAPGVGTATVLRKDFRITMLGEHFNLLH